MHAMTRRFAGKGAKELARLLEQKQAEVQKLMKEVPGLLSYNLIETADGCISFTLCKDKAGTDRSLTAAKDWLKANAGNLGLEPPTVWDGKVLVHVGADVAAH